MALLEELSCPKTWNKEVTLQARWMIPKRLGMCHTERYHYNAVHHVCLSDLLVFAVTIQQGQQEQRLRFS